MVSGGWYSALNIGGLSLVLAVSLLLFWWVKDELNYDRFHSDTDRIYRINSHFGTGSEEDTFPYTPAPLAVSAVKSIPGVENAVRVDYYPFHTFRVKDKTFTESGDIAYVDENFLDVFDGFKIVFGDAKSLFSSPNSIVLTEKLAKKYFGKTNAIGEVLTNVGKNRIFVVSGILADIPDVSTLKFGMFVPMSVKKAGYHPQGDWKVLDQNWDEYSFETYLKLTPGTDPKIIGGKLTAMKNKARKANKDGSDFNLQGLRELHLYDADTADGQASGVQQVKILGLVAILLLSIGCINYVNLTTARASRRSKEVGVRKVVGAGIRQLAQQLLVESVLMLTLSLIFAIVFIQILLPFYYEITGKTGKFVWSDPQTWMVMLGTLLVAFMLSGIYPALLVSRFNPIQSLRGQSGKAGGVRLRKVLVVTQFSLTTALIIGTFVIASQLHFIQERDPGYNREHVFMFDARQFAPVFKRTLAGESSISAISASSDTPVHVDNATGGLDWDGKEANRTTIFAQASIDKDFIPNFGIKLIVGQNFTGTKADSMHYILNETAAKQTGYKDAIGKRFKREDVEGIIIGVVKDFSMASVREPVRPLVLFSNPENNNTIHVHTTGRLAPMALAAAKKLWKKLYPDYPFEYSFVDDVYNRQYKAEQQTGQLFNFFSGVAVFISCLGLLGLASYTAEQRTKEIGIRKVLGASVLNITSLLSVDFLKLVVIAIIIACPVAWLVMDLWLKDFAYRIEIRWWVFAYAGVLSILTALLTISFQSIKAALMNPVKSLKSD